MSTPLHLLAALAATIIMMAMPLCSSFSTKDSMHPTTCVSRHRISSLETMSMVSATSIAESEAELTTKFSRLKSFGVDYGLRRTGIAVTTGGYRPRPLAILSDLNNTQLATTIVNYVLSEQATNIVLGLPLNKNGTDSQQSMISRGFGQTLLQEVRSRCGTTIDLMLWDERYTSKEAAARITAEAMAKNQPIPSASDLETELDADAACIILEDYYKELGVDAEKIELEDETVAQQCEEMYRLNLKRQEQLRVERMEENERGRNARREMMERDRAMEEENGNNASSGNKKKKKKKKRKKK